jgi:hypothetical protein
MHRIAEAIAAPLGGDLTAVSVKEGNGANRQDAKNAKKICSSTEYFKESRL